MKEIPWELLRKVALFQMLVVFLRCETQQQHINSINSSCYCQNWKKIITIPTYTQQRPVWYYFERLWFSRKCRQAWSACLSATFSCFWNKCCFRFPTFVCDAYRSLCSTGYQAVCAFVVGPPSAFLQPWSVLWVNRATLLMAYSAIDLALVW